MCPGPHANTWEQMTRPQIATASADRTLRSAFAPRRQFAPGGSRLDQSRRPVRLGDGRAAVGATLSSGPTSNGSCRSCLTLDLVYLERAPLRYDVAVIGRTMAYIMTLPGRAAGIRRSARAAGSPEADPLARGRAAMTLGSSLITATSRTTLAPLAPGSCRLGITTYTSAAHMRALALHGGGGRPFCVHSQPSPRSPA